MSLLQIKLTPDAISGAREIVCRRYRLERARGKASLNES